jgi:hypothetical protein
MAEHEKQIKIMKTASYFYFSLALNNQTDKHFSRTEEHVTYHLIALQESSGCNMSIKYLENWQFMRISLTI